MFAAGADGKLNTADDILSDDVLSGNLATPTNTSASGSTIPGLAQSLFIPNITPDAGLSAPANSFFTFFGQFFDHGLDLISKDDTNGIVYIPLTQDDPLYVQGGSSNFMILTRAQDQPGPDEVHWARRTMSTPTSTRPRRSSTKARPMPRTRRIRCSCANT